jgi:hypothetical protein
MQNHWRRKPRQINRLNRLVDNNIQGIGNDSGSQANNFRLSSKMVMIMDCYLTRPFTAGKKSAAGLRSNAFIPFVTKLPVWSTVTISLLSCIMNSSLSNFVITFDILHFHKQPILEVLIVRAGVLGRLSNPESFLSSPPNMYFLSQFCIPLHFPAF